MSEDETLANNLKTYAQAMAEEHRIAKTGTSDELLEASKNRLVALLPEAGDTLLEILRMGGKEDAVRFQAAKFVFEYTMGKPQPANTKEDDTERIMRELMGKPSDSNVSSPHEN